MTWSRAEKFARLRAYQASDARRAHRFIVKHFGGDYHRAAWFFDELAKTQERRETEMTNSEALG